MTLLLLMDTFTWKSVAPCMALNNLECSQTKKSQHTAGLFVHKTRPISFTLVVNGIRVHYINKDDALHLEKPLSDYYPMKSDWKGDQYIGIDLNWDYPKRTVKLSMKGYVNKALLQFQHLKPTIAMPLHPNIFHQIKVRNKK